MWHKYPSIQCPSVPPIVTTESRPTQGVPLFHKMKHILSGLVLLAILFTPTTSAPLERGHGALHRLSPHRGLSRRVRAAPAKQPQNLTFTPIHSGGVPLHVEYDASPQLQTSYFRFSATLLGLRLDDNVADVEWHDTQVPFRSADTYVGRHVVISTPESVVSVLQQWGVSQDDMPHYIRQNVHVADPDTGNQYQLVPDSNPEGSVFTDSSVIMISESPLKR
ncbi:hypothetical protein HD554DRAFT_1222764 [Boletus coccyginus]|nr:hypothetical protein HD554DRAFT_1222764 [Boletus coccyginus]